MPLTISRHLRLGLVGLVVLLAFGLAAGQARATVVIGQGWETGTGPDGVGGTGWSTNTTPGAAATWHVLNNPQTVSVSSGINPLLVTLPDSGALLPAIEGTHIAWFGDGTNNTDTTGTFCGTDFATLPGNQPTAGQPPPKNGCTSTSAFESELISPTVDLTTAASVILSFQSWFEIESVNANNFDLMRIDYSTDGGTTWTNGPLLNPADNPAGSHDQSYSNEGLGQSPAWQPVLVDLSAAKGSATARFRFVFNTVDSLFQGFRGWGIDAVQLRTPFDAPAPHIDSVKVCSGTANAPVTTINGQNFVLGSTVNVDGSPQSAQTTSAGHIEITALSSGSHTIQVVSPSGGSTAASNTVTAAGGNCAVPPPPHTTATQLICNYVVATASDTCTATVGDATSLSSKPTGTVGFSATGGVFTAGSTCSLVATPNSPNVASCAVQYLPPATGSPVMTAAYQGDSGHAGSQGSTSALLNAGAAGQLITGIGISPNAFAAAPSGAAFSAAKKKYGARISYTLKAPALVKFAAQRAALGRKAGKKCVKQNKHNAGKHSCTRWVPVPGSFQVIGARGTNSVLFRGRLGGRKLAPGKYRMVATPSVLGKAGTKAYVRFGIKKR